MAKQLSRKSKINKIIKGERKLKMKRVWISCAVFAAILVWVGFSNMGLKNIAGVSAENLDLCEKYVENGDYDNAARHFKAAHDKWNGSLPFLGAVAKHAEIDEIVVEFEQGDSYLKSKSYSDFLMIVYSVRKRISHIEEMEKITLGNVF